MDWTQVLTVFAVIATNLGTVIALYIQTDTKISTMQTEMKDFHGRLERQDAEFKSHMLHIHSKNEGRFEL